MQRWLRLTDLRLNFKNSALEVLAGVLLFANLGLVNLVLPDLLVDDFGLPAEPIPRVFVDGVVRRVGGEPERLCHLGPLVVELDQLRDHQVAKRLRVHLLVYLFEQRVEHDFTGMSDFVLVTLAELGRDPERRWLPRWRRLSFWMLKTIGLVKREHLLA